MRFFSRNKIIAAVVSTLLMAVTLQVAAQKPFMREIWLNESATPVRTHALASDERGYLWLGTDEGLLRYNGSSFVAFEDSAASPVTAIGILKDEIWVGYKNGAIGKVRNDKQVSLVYKNGRNDEAITGIYPATNGTALATTEDQILYLGPKGRLIAGQSTGLPDGFFYSLVPLSTTRALLASDNGITNLSFQSGKWQANTYSSSHGLPDNILRVIKKIPKTDLCWLGTQQGGIAIYNTGTNAITIPYYAGVWRWGQVNDIITMSSTTAYASTEDGYLLQLELTDSLHVSITPYYYRGKNLGKLVADRSGNLWCASAENLLKISAPYARYIPLSKPYALQQLTAMACDDNGLWLAQDNALYQIRNGDTESKPMLIAKTLSAITALYTDSSNRLWIGTLGNGLWYIPDNEQSLHPFGQEALYAENILSIACTKTDIWVATLTGVYELSNPESAGDVVRAHFTKSSGIGTDYVYQIYPDNEHRIWMATDGAGIVMYDGQSFHRWNEDIGVKVAYSVTQDARGDIWSATLEKGLCRFHEGKWRHFGREDGMQETSVSSIAATGSGTIVAVNRQGIDQWYPGSGQIRHYNRRLGFDIDSTSSALNCIAHDAEGNVFVPFEHGIVRLNSEAGHFDIRPVVNIAQASLFTTPISNDRHRFASDENYLSFFFDGINYSNPEPVIYRYKLEGYNNNWIQTSDNRVTFPQLPPGNYTFRLQGSLNQRFTAASEASFAFHIAPPLWRRAWFIVLSLIAVALLARYLIRLRDKSVNNILRLRQERLSFEYEHLKSQVNPHFLFNSLNTLASLIEDGEGQAATTYTQRLSDLYRNMLAYRDQDLILLAEEWDILEAYLHIQRCRFEDAFVVKVDIPKNVLQTKKIVPMSLQLLAENAIKHNVVSRSNPLVIRIVADEDYITVTNQLQPKLYHQEGEGIGLGHIRRRYELLTNRKISFGPNNGLYIVSLPLL